MRNMTTRPQIFAAATLTPAVLLVLGAILGGAFVFAAVLYLTAVTTLLDRLGQNDTLPQDVNNDRLPITIAITHLALLPIIIWALTAEHLVPLEKAGLFLAAGFWFGQVSNANAHELIHRSTRSLHRLGMWCYITLLFGHHTSAHVLVHHRHVGTQADPNTSRKGENLYRYILRAWGGSFRQGFVAEAARLRKINRPAWRNPYVIYVGGSLLCLIAATLTGGWQALIAYLGLCAHAQLQLLMSDYVQHYGLTRKINADGQAEPVAKRHSWNSPHWFSSALMLNATRHSDHHAHPARPYPALELEDDVPMLPRPLPLMASIALVPPLWRRIMDPRLEKWRDA